MLTLIQKRTFTKLAISKEHNTRGERKRERERERGFIDFSVQ
jgi:hypothetical protein